MTVGDGSEEPRNNESESNDASLSEETSDGLLADDPVEFVEDAVIDAADDPFSFEEAILVDPEFELVRGERDEYLRHLQQLQADFDNYRRRSLKENEEAKDRAGEELVRLLLPALDTLMLAISHIKDDEHEDAKALRQVANGLLAPLQAAGLVVIDPMGESFDPNIADAVLHEPGESDTPMVTEVLRHGYRWKQKVIRAAMVKVAG